MKLHGTKKTNRKRKVAAAAVSKRTVSTEYSKSFNKRNRETLRIEKPFLRVWVHCQLCRTRSPNGIQAWFLTTNRLFFIDGLQQLIKKKQTNKICKNKQKLVNNETNKQSQKQSHYATITFLGTSQNYFSAF